MLASSISIHGPLTAETGSATSSHGVVHWVDVKETGKHGYGSLSIHCASRAGAELIAEAINAAFSEAQS